MIRPDPQPAPPASAADTWLTPGRFALLLGLLVLVSFPEVLLGGRTFVIRDFGLFGYPLAYFHREAFWRGELPLWNPLSNCGLPFLAQWNTLTLYPPSLIYLLLPLTWSLSFFCLAHLYWGGLGMYFLAHRWTRCRLAASLAGIVFAFNGLSLNALMWPNIEAALGWLPWVIWLVQRAWQQGGRVLVWAVLAGSMQMLAGGPEPVLFTWFILLALAVGDWLSWKYNHRWTRINTDQKAEEGQVSEDKAAAGPSSRLQDLCPSVSICGCSLFLRLCLVGVLVALVCAVQLLPFLQLLLHSQRDSGFTTASHDWSMPFWGWANFLVPLFRTSPTAHGVFYQNGQYWTSSYYTGIGTVLLAAVALRRLRDWRVRLLAGLAFLGAVLALGEGTLLYTALRACLPGIGFLRYPIKAVILVLALAPLLAAFGVVALRAQPPQTARFETSLTVTVLVLIGALVAWESVSNAPADVWRATWQSGLSRALLLGLLLLLCLALRKASGAKRAMLGLGLLACVWLDLLTHVPSQNPTVPRSTYTPGVANAVLKWGPEPRLGQSRAMLGPAAREILRFNPLRSSEQTYTRNRLAARANCNLLDAVPQVDGFFSMTPKEASRITALLYDQPETNRAALLDFMGVSQITAPGTTTEWAHRPTAMSLVTAGQEPIFADDQVAFAAVSGTCPDLRQAVYLPHEARSAITAKGQPAARVQVTAFANQSLTAETESPTPAMVVLSQTHYPAWEARIDDRPAKVWRANYAFQAVEVPAGKHKLTLRYRDKALAAGVGLSGLGLACCIVLWGLPLWGTGRVKGGASPDGVLSAQAK